MRRTFCTFVSIVGVSCQRRSYSVHWGFSTDELLAEFYQRETIHFTESGDVYHREPSDLGMLLGQKATIEVTDENGEVLVRKNRKFTQSAIKKMRAAGVSRIQL